MSGDWRRIKRWEVSNGRLQGRWLCFREHPAGPTTHGWECPKPHETFGNWTLCQLLNAWNGFEIGSPARILFWLGIIDAPEEGGTLRWRWDFWNADSRRWWPRSTWRLWSHHMERP